MKGAMTGAPAVVDAVPGVERDPAYVSSARPTSSTAGLASWVLHRVVVR